MSLKEEVRKHWDNEPCGTGGITFPKNSRAYYKAIEFRRDRLDPYIKDYAGFDKWKGKEVLEVGCGAGSDLVRFAKAGAIVTGVDLSSKSVDIARSRLEFYNRKGEVYVGDAENLPFNNAEFALVFSWGVLHHTPDIKKAIQEIRRVLKPDGKICIMLYRKPSLVTLQMYLAFGLLKLRPFHNIDSILANNHESLGTKAYTTAEARNMFGRWFHDLTIKNIVTSYDVRYARGKYLPFWATKFIPNWLGWNMVIQGKKG